MEKSHVGLGTYVCPVCGVKHGEVVLLDKRLKNTLTRDEHMGLVLCPEHQKLHDDKYIALVGVEVPETMEHATYAKIDELPRTGKLVHVRREAWGNIFNDNTPLPDQPLVFVPDNLIEELMEFASQFQMETPDENRTLH